MELKAVLRNEVSVGGPVELLGHIVVLRPMAVVHDLVSFPPAASVRLDGAVLDSRRVLPLVQKPQILVERLREIDVLRLRSRRDREVRPLAFRMPPARMARRNRRARELRLRRGDDLDSLGAAAARHLHAARARPAVGDVRRLDLRLVPRRGEGRADIPAVDDSKYTLRHSADKARGAVGEVDVGVTGEVVVEVARAHARPAARAARGDRRHVVQMPPAELRLAGLVAGESPEQRLVRVASARRPEPGQTVGRVEQRRAVLGEMRRHIVLHPCDGAAVAREVEGKAVDRDVDGGEVGSAHEALEAEPLAVLAPHAVALVPQALRDRVLDGLRPFPEEGRVLRLAEALRDFRHRAADEGVVGGGDRARAAVAPLVVRIPRVEPVLVEIKAGHLHVAVHPGEVAFHAVVGDLAHEGVVVRPLPVPHHGDGELLAHVVRGIALRLVGNAPILALGAEMLAGVLLEALLPARRVADVPDAPARERLLPVRRSVRYVATLEHRVRDDQLARQERVDDRVGRLDLDRPRDPLEVVGRRIEHRRDIARSDGALAVVPHPLPLEVVVRRVATRALRNEHPFAVELRWQVAGRLHEKSVGLRAAHHLHRALAPQIVFGAPPHISVRNVLRAVAELQDAAKLLVEPVAAEHLQDDLRPVARPGQGLARRELPVVAVPPVERSVELAVAVVRGESAGDRRVFQRRHGARAGRTTGESTVSRHADCRDHRERLQCIHFHLCMFLSVVTQ